MTDTQRLRDLCAQRLEIVQELARLNARQLQNRQTFGGLELELMLCERDQSQGADKVALAHRLAQARARCEAAQALLAADERELAHGYKRLDELDRAISEC